MKAYRLFLAIALLCAGVSPTVGAQITLSSDYFPEPGDSLLISVATEAERASLGAVEAGADLNWDFGDPEAAAEYTLLVEPVTGDSVFVRADARYRTVDSIYNYYRTTDTAYYLVGLLRSLPFFERETFSARYDQPEVARRAGITFGDAFRDSTVQRLQLSVDELPESVMNSNVGGALVNYDSIRITTTSVRGDTIDAYGTLMLRGAAYNVLREKRVERVDTRVFVKSGTSDFIDVTSIIIGFDGSTREYLGEQPVRTTYYYWAEGELEPIVEIAYSEEEAVPEAYYFKRGGKRITSLDSSDPRVEKVRVYPNPVAGEFQVTYTLREPARVTVRLLDATGRELESWPVGRQGEGEQRFGRSLSDYPHGVYYLDLLTDRGRAVRKLIKQ